MFDTKTARLLAFKVALAAALAAAATGCGTRPVELPPTSPPEVPTAPPFTAPPILSKPPTLIFYNGNVLTMERDQPAAQALAVAEELIVAVGTNDSILALQTPATQLVDLQGRTLMPGFVDAHTHLFNNAADTYHMDLDEVQQMALENGITTLGNMYTTREFLAEMRQVEKEGRLRIRTSLYLIHTTNCGDIVGDWWKDVPPTRERGEMLRIGGIKIFSDGGSCKRPALSYETAPGSGYGDLFLTGEQIAPIVREAQAMGHQVAIHALGDRAIEAALDGIEAGLDGAPNTLRHRIEHNAVLRPDLLPRYGQIGIVATIFASYSGCSSFKYLSPAPYNTWEWNWPSLIAANPDLHIAWHGDDPGIPPLSPILDLYGFVTRKQAEDGTLRVCETPEWIQDDKLTAAQALPMMTRESAYALFRDEEVGTLLPGKYADLLILSDNPLAVDSEALLHIQVWMTMVGGRVEWCAPGREGYCPGTDAAAESPLAAPVRIRIQMTTTSDWATLTLTRGGSLSDLEIVSASKQATGRDVNGNRISINQAIGRAESGAAVELVVDATLSDAHTGGQLEFVIESGAIGDTTIKLFNYLRDSPVEASTTVLNEMIKTFRVPVEEFISR